MTGWMILGVADMLAPTHGLAIVPLGLLIGRDPWRWALLAVFIVGLTAGSLAIAAAVRETPAALVLLVIAATAGLTVVTAWQPPSVATGLLALAGGMALALNTPPQATTIGGAVMAQIGGIIAAMSALALVIALGSRARAPWQRVGLRIAGSWAAASAILVLALRLAR
jgi:urease accessory protein